MNGLLQKILAWDNEQEPIRAMSLMDSLTAPTRRRAHVNSIPSKGKEITIDKADREEWSQTQEQDQAEQYLLPTKQDVLDTLEPGQTEQSRLRHLIPEPVPRSEEHTSELQSPV